MESAMRYANQRRILSRAEPLRRRILAKIRRISCSVKLIK